MYEYCCLPFERIWVEGTAQNVFVMVPYPKAGNLVCASPPGVFQNFKCLSPQRVDILKGHVNLMTKLHVLVFGCKTLLPC